MSVPVLTHRRDLRPGDLIFPEEILRIGRTLDFQLGCVSKEVQQEMFGQELDTSSLCDWLNLHTAYDFALQDVADHIDITLCRNFGEEEHPFTYPLNRVERDVLRGEMEACCQLSVPAAHWHSSTTICWCRRRWSRRSSRLGRAASPWTR
ncbi:hypothetical protein [Flavonifractor plautii]|uniref:hypothetical protein n=1 Tax=Flavonifractor plautii TaxID=292800 RepID=UPI0013975C95|nr:hypothetical protein [Flavonifractor plautii]QIA29674.1 hypothetical protein GXM20_03430 [Flavonifractor plautii]